MRLFKFKIKALLQHIHNPHFWVVVVLLAIISILHYPQLYGNPSFLIWSETKHTLERVMLLVPVIYSGFIFGTWGGFVCLVISLIIMLPKAVMLIGTGIDPLLETIVVTIVGSVTNLLIWIGRGSLYRSETAQHSLFRIIDGSPLPIFVINDQHKVVYWNTAIEVLTSIKKPEVIGTGNHWKAFYGSHMRVLADLILDQVPPEEMSKFYQGMFRKSLLIEGAYEAEGYFLVPPSRSGKWLRITGSPIKDRDGKIIYVVESMEDITERKRAEDALRESESNFRNVFESALDAIWVTDYQGNIQNVNESTARLTGYTIQELVRSNLKIFLTASSLEAFHEIQNKLISKQIIQSPYEQEIIRKDGSLVVCMVHTNVMGQSREMSIFQSIARDITEAKRLYDNQHYYLKEITRAQEEERKRIARELHDSTAQNLIAVLHQLENLLQDEARETVGKTKGLWGIYERIRDILQEIRRFSRDLRPSILDDLGLMPVLDWLTGEFQNEYGISTTLNKIGQERRLTPEMELLLFRIVQESLANIAKHSKATEAKVNIEFTESKIKIIVKDNGIGFTPVENIGWLLQSGKLGLAGMHERVQLLGGKFRIYTESGGGTLVMVEAPIRTEAS